MNVQSSIGPLEQALHDPGFVLLGPPENDNRFYPVRVTAEGALRKLRYLATLRQSDPAKFEELTRRLRDFPGQDRPGSCFRRGAEESAGPVGRDRYYPHHEGSHRAAGSDAIPRPAALQP